MSLWEYNIHLSEVLTLVFKREKKNTMEKGISSQTIVSDLKIGIFHRGLQH